MQPANRFEIHARAESHGATEFQLQYVYLVMVCNAEPREFSSKMNFYACFSISFCIIIQFVTWRFLENVLSKLNVDILLYVI